MARLFNDAASHSLLYSGAVVSAAPCTFASWMRTNDLGVSQTIVSVGDSSKTNNYKRLSWSQGQNAIIAQEAAGGSVFAATTAAATANTWHHAVAAFDSSSPYQIAWLDGGNKGTSTSDKTPSGIDQTGIGAWARGSPTQYFSGDLAEAAIWNVVLTDAEVAMLALGLCPLFVRPANLVGYWPIIGRYSPEIDLVGGFDMTVTGATVSNHPRIIRPSAQIFQFPSVVTGISAAVSQVTETDLAQALTKSKNKALGQNTETDLAQALTAGKAATVNQVTETDLAQPVTAPGAQVVAVGQVTETDLAQALTAAKSKATVQVTETDLAQSITAQKTLAVNQVSETNLAQAISKAKQLGIAQVTETNAALGTTAVKGLAVNRIIETDLAQAISVAKALGITQVTETDLAQTITVAGILRPVGLEYTAPDNLMEYTAPTDS